MGRQKVDFSQFSKKFENIHYADDSKEQVLDIVLPENGGNNYPLIVFIHGGGWASGCRRMENASSALKLVSAGYAVATVDYRLAPEGVWPKQVYDVKTAIRFLRANGEKYQLSTDKIVLWGNSAGGHIAQLVAATGGKDLLEDKSMGNAEQSSRVDGLISWYAISEVSELDADIELQTGKKSVKHGSNMECRPCMMAGFIINENKERARKLGSAYYVTQDFVPTLLQHGKADMLVSYLQSVHLYHKIIKICKNDRAILELFPTAEHGDPQFSNPQNLWRIIHFIDGIFGIKRNKEEDNKELPDIHLMPMESVNI